MNMTHSARVNLALWDYKNIQHHEKKITKLEKDIQERINEMSPEELKDYVMTTNAWNQSEE